ncbi:MAG: DUF488 family protein, partial [Patescibacteria group bacterium]|nr:DUF488 family protein [Patescibacteria group bacterium]
MTTKTKRVYDAPAKSDGYRILADRLWPRGVSKADAAVDWWAKELAPSSELREWYHAKPDERFAEFTRRYRAELAANRKALRALAAEKLGRRTRATLLTANKEVAHSHLPTLAAFL